MIVIPAIDIRNGNSVRLKQGRIEDETIHSTDPVFIAKLWKAKGAKRLHVIDLDGAISESNQNEKIIKEICKTLDIDIEVGGGIRTIEKADKIFKMGASFVIFGTSAIYQPELVREAVEKYGPEKIIAAVDAKDGKIAVGGWKEVSHIGVDDFVAELQSMFIKQIIYTDIKRDGMLTGPDFDGLEKLCKSGMSVIASGGIKTIDDLKNLKSYESKGLIGAIVGSALYTDDFKLEEAVKAAQ
ncbi:MAG: 1-(5-phosphoribosyl)-5-[(5-phosphoribosylamino)methylideneamino]imidazole-4-carboxamide isomerase [Elusimicrobiota bacterium]|jgi:phosphoribosylformimino-5-aminoimidazole carboxamide ribotide isomerase|nr:1-(5-phosphoribosyl)-5-[(5-phosphoribosylamino)methylideneamino]imidazole-4-carboxamide isomerase [Elusimicrobiota bacterium]